MLAPFSYSQIVFSSFVAFLFFGHVPDDLTMVGMFIIILSGAGLVWWQRR
jgi:drug/metabolite transporter (DMT)-like permease